MIWVTGSRGQLGSEIELLCGHRNTYVFTNSLLVNLLDKRAVKQFVVENNIDTIVNCTAYTAVDKAETDIHNATLYNVELVKNLVEISKIYGIKLIHISTDFIFSGSQGTHYREDDLPSPLSVYGRTKWEGEQVIIDLLENYIIIRTSWLYSTFGNNFVKTITKLAKEREVLSVVNDQIGTPTYARNLAQCIITIVENHKECNGVFHYSNEGIASWYDFAHTLVSLQNIPCSILPISTNEYPLPAKRPPFSVMNINKIKKTFNITIPHWQESLKECIVELEKKL